MANFDDIAMLAIAEVVDDAAAVVAEQRRPFYPRIDAFQLGDIQFIRMFRLTKELVREVIRLVSPYIEEGSRESAINIETKVNYFNFSFTSFISTTEFGLFIHNNYLSYRVKHAAKIADVLHRKMTF